MHTYSARGDESILLCCVTIRDVTILPEVATMEGDERVSLMRLINSSPIVFNNA